MQWALPLQFTLAKLQLPASASLGLQPFSKEPWKATLPTPCPSGPQPLTLGRRHTHFAAPSLCEWHNSEVCVPLYFQNFFRDPPLVAHCGSWTDNTSFTGCFLFLGSLSPYSVFLVSLKKNYLHMNPCCRICFWGNQN